MKVAVAGVLLLTALLCGVVAQRSASNAAFGAVVSSLVHFQNADGGFRFHLDDREESSLEATFHALFLSSLYGLKNEIRTDDAISFIQSRHNTDGGYSQSASKTSSDIESLRQALISIQHASPVTQVSDGHQNAAAYVASLFDENSGLFRNGNGEVDIKATAMALDALNILGELSKFGESRLARIRDFLKQHNKGSHFLFPSSSLPRVSANYYAIVIGSLVNFDFGNTADWASYIISLQAPSGGVYEDETHSAVTLDATAHAAASLRALHLHSDYPFANPAALSEYLKSAPRDLRSASQAHLALASTKLFTDNLKTSISYQVVDSKAVITADEIEQGLSVTPLLSVSSFSELAHAGLDIDVDVTLPSGKSSHHKLSWSSASKQYVADAAIDTTGLLGNVQFHYLVRCSVAALGGTFSFELNDVKRIGYHLTVVAKASHQGKQIAAGESGVGIGAEFSFDVSLKNKTTQIHAGDFDVIFAVNDASNVELHSSKAAGAGHKEAGFHFAYTLSSAKLPSGVISFVVSVSNKNGVHSRHVVSYPLALPMVATKIQVEKQNYKIGEKVKISMVPAVLDGKTVSALAAGSAGAVAGRRQFVLDISSAGGVLLDSVKGVAKAAANGDSEYHFETTVAASLQSIGSNVVSFRYIPATGNAIALQNYDSTNGELYSESHDAPLDYVVDADLRVINAQKPSSKNINYGSSVNFKFQVKDSLSGKFIGRSKADAANVFVVLQHKDAALSHPLISAVHPASLAAGSSDSYVINWALNANAVAGEGQLLLVARDADGKDIRLVEEGKNAAVSVDISIGGKIETSHQVYSSGHPSLHASVFVVQFQLSCDQVALSDAQLRAAVVYRSGSGEFSPVSELEDLAVATNDGSYEVSWVLPHSAAHSGEYKVQLYRAVDTLRAREAQEQAEQKRLREEVEERRRAQKGESSSSSSSSAAEAVAVTPFIEISVNHRAPGASFPVRMELIGLVLGVAVSVFLSQYKTALIAPKKK